MIAPKVRNPRVLEVEDYAVSIYAHCDVSNTVSTLRAYVGIPNQNGYKSSKTNERCSIEWKSLFACTSCDRASLARVTGGSCRFVRSLYSWKKGGRGKTVPGGG